MAFLAALAMAGRAHYRQRRARELFDQLNAASHEKSGMITMIIGFGSVILGPVLLAALAVLTPQQWIPITFERIVHFLTGTRDEHEHPRGPRPRARITHAPSRIAVRLSFAFRFCRLPVLARLRCAHSAGTLHGLFNRKAGHEGTSAHSVPRHRVRHRRFHPAGRRRHPGQSRRLIVAGFVLGLAVFWFLVERILLNLRRKQRGPRGTAF